MALVEAQLAGKYTISLAFPELGEDKAGFTPIPFMKQVETLPQLLSALQDVVNGINEGRAVKGNRHRAFAGSTQKALDAVVQFWEEDVQVVA